MWSSEMQIRGVAVEPVDLDDFMLPTSSRPRRSVPRKDYLAMLDVHKSVKCKHEYLSASTSPAKKLSSPQKTPEKKESNPTTTTTTEDDSDEQLKTWKILVKHNLISQVNKQICRQNNNGGDKLENNDENSRQNCINKLQSKTINVRNTTQQQNNVLNLKSDQVKNIFNHFKWFRNSQEKVCSSNFELSTKEQVSDIVTKSEVNSSSVTCTEIKREITEMVTPECQLDCAASNEGDAQQMCSTEPNVKKQLTNKLDEECLKITSGNNVQCSQQIIIQKPTESNATMFTNQLATMEKIGNCTQIISAMNINNSQQIILHSTDINVTKQLRTKVAKIDEIKVYMQTKLGTNIKNTQRLQHSTVTKQVGNKVDVRETKQRRRRCTNDKRERKHQCTYCCKLFLTRSHLNSHVMVHTGVKPFECNICKRKFSQIGNLQNHLARIHLGERKYACTFCERRFTELGNVLRHERSVHDDRRQFECELCKYRFTAKNALKIHLETSHIRRHLKCFTCKNKCKVLPSLYQFIVDNRKWNTFKCAKCNALSKVVS